MSYARYGQDGSDVYVWEHVCGGLVCCEDLSGLLEPERYPLPRSYDVADVLAHLQNHHAANGDVVPDYVVPDIRADWEAGAFRWAEPPPQAGNG